MAGANCQALRDQSSPRSLSLGLTQNIETAGLKGSPPSPAHSSLLNGADKQISRVREMKNHG